MRKSLFEKFASNRKLHSVQSFILYSSLTSVAKFKTGVIKYFVKEKMSDRIKN